MSLAGIALRQAASWRVLDAVPTISALDGHECDNREAIVRHLKVVGRTPGTGDWSLKETG